MYELVIRAFSLFPSLLLFIMSYYWYILRRMKKNGGLWIVMEISGGHIVL